MCGKKKNTKCTIISHLSKIKVSSAGCYVMLSAEKRNRKCAEAITICTHMTLQIYQDVAFHFLTLLLCTAAQSGRGSCLLQHYLTDYHSSYSCSDTLLFISALLSTGNQYLFNIQTKCYLFNLDLKMYRNM